MWAFFTKALGAVMKNSDKILAIDPGRHKCGLAIIEDDHILLQEIVLRTELLDRVKSVLPPKGPIVIGDRTGSAHFYTEMAKEMPHVMDRVLMIDEHLSSVEARKEYWIHNPPTGIRRIVPVSLQVPPVPIDDYVAVILARRYQSNSN